MAGKPSRKALLSWRELAAGAAIHRPPRFPRGSARGEDPTLPCTESKRLRSQCRRWLAGGRPTIQWGRAALGRGADERGRIGVGGDAVAVVLWSGPGPDGQIR